MHILLLGARGMLGRDLATAFNDQDVTAWDKEELDLTDEQAMSERIGMLEPDLVVNVAAYTEVDGAEDDQEEADAVNGYAVGNLAVTCASLDLPLLHVSTEMVFGQEREGGYAETDEPVLPKNAYGRSKLLGETLLRENGRDYWLVRTAWLFGKSQEDFFARLLRVAEGKEAVAVVADVVGSPTYTRDLAVAIRSLVREEAPFGVYHLINSGVASRADAAERFFQLLGKAVRVERVASDRFPARASRQRISVLKNLKRPPLRSWEEALKEYVRHVHGAR